MKVSRRVLPDAPARRGWCPGLARPMPTGDGLLARIHPPLGILTVAQLRAVAGAAARFGNGHVDVTARANLQLRGVTEATRSGLVAALERIGLGDTRADGGPQRLTLTSPLAGLSPSLIDVPALARAIEAHGLSISGLPAKTLVLIEGGSGTDLPGITADIYVRARTFGRAAVDLADGDGVTRIATFNETLVAEAVAGFLRVFATSGHRRVRDLDSDKRAAFVQSLSACALRDDVERGSLSQWEREPRRASRDPFGHVAPRHVNSVAHSREGTRAPFANTERTLDLEAPFGRCTVLMLAQLADAAETLGTDEIRLSPTRGFVLPIGRCLADQLSGIRAKLASVGFVTTSDDPRRAVAACPGAPACASGTTPTGADAARLAEAFRPYAARGMTAHVSGCAKGCAHPGRADLTLVGRAGRYGIVLAGTPGDAPALELTFEAALERVRRAKSGTLAQAFGNASLVSTPRAASDPRTTS